MCAAASYDFVVILWGSYCQAVFHFGNAKIARYVVMITTMAARTAAKRSAFTLWCLRRRFFVDGGIIGMRFIVLCW